MSKRHTEQLCERAGSRIAKLLRKISREHLPTSIDITMNWPPEEDRVLFLIGADNIDRDWDFEIRIDDWSVDGLRNPANATLLKVITSFFRRNSVLKNAKCYLRQHDDISAIDLSNGRTVDDGDRPELNSPGRVPFSKPPKLLVNRKRNRELVFNGDSIHHVQQLFKLDDRPQQLGGGWEYSLDDLGLTVGFNNRRKVAHTTYNAPFQHKICGIWIGLSAWQVHKILGTADTEYIKTDWERKKSLRTWEYKINGKLFAEFDHRDRLVEIGRHAKAG